jgi:hypothetical protein
LTNQKKVAFTVAGDAIFKQLGLCYRQWQNLLVTRFSWIYTRNSKIRAALLVPETVADLKEALLLVGHRLTAAVGSVPQDFVLEDKDRIKIANG